MLQSQRNSLFNSYAAARAAGNYDAAIGYLIDLQALAFSGPIRVERSLGGAGKQVIEWSSESIGQAIAELRKEKMAASAAISGPFVQIPVTYARPDSSGDYT